MKRIVCLILAAVLMCSATAFAHPFTDVSGHWAEADIERGFANKAVNGDPDGRFRPDDEITRAEFLKMLTAEICTRAEVEIPDEFSDDRHWSSKYYNFASMYIYRTLDTQVEGIMPGVMMTAEDFDLPISRWEMAFMLAEAVYNVAGVEALGDGTVAFTDKEEIEKLPEEIVVSIANCNEFLLMKGDEKNLFNPFDKGTRAEAITVINRIDDMLLEIIESFETTQKQQQDAYLKDLEDGLVTYEEIPSGHPVATILMENNKKVLVELYPEYAPQTVANFVKLAKEGFYNGLTFHRVVEGFMAQGGDPNGDGTGGSEGYITGEFKANGFEQNTLSHTRGVISMARSSHPDSASSQFFICYDDASFLDGQYAAFGKVISGMNVIDDFTKTEMEVNNAGELASPKEPIVIKSITVSTKK